MVILSKKRINGNKTTEGSCGKKSLGQHSTKINCACAVRLLTSFGGSLKMDTSVCWCLSEAML